MCIQIHRSKYARFCIFYDVHLRLHTCFQLLTLCTKHSSMLICVVFVHHVEFVQSGASINRYNDIASVRYNDMHLTLYTYGGREREREREIGEEEEGYVSWP